MPAMHLDLNFTEAQTCIVGFPDTTSLCTSLSDTCGTREIEAGGPPSSRVRTRIIPEMNFTCSGTVTHWRAAGEFRDAGNAIINSVLSIWRERSSQPGICTCDKVDEIELGICGSEDPASSVTGMSNVYECILPQSERVSVQPGDIVGIELPSDTRAKFRLYFDNTNSGPINYVFNSHGSVFSLSQASSTVQDQPQISLTVVPDTLMTAFPTTTEASTGPPITQSRSTVIEPPAVTMYTTTTATDSSTKRITQGGSTVTEPSAVTTYTMTEDDSAATDSSTEMNSSMGMTEIPDSASQQSDGPNFGIIIRSVVGGVVGIILLPAVVILTLALVYQSRKHKRENVTKNSIVMTQNDKINDELDMIEVMGNLSYIPVFCQISTENNVAYGEAENQDSNHLYESIDPQIEDSTT